MTDFNQPKDTNMITATETQIEQLRKHAVNDVTREIMAHGVLLSHDQADDLGEEVLGWMGGRLGLNVEVTDRGVQCSPPKHYSGKEERRAAAAVASRHDELLAGLAKHDDGAGTLGIIVDQALADDPDVSIAEVAAIVENAIRDAKAERNG